MRACCETLEHRRLLTFVYNATEGNDELVVGLEGDLPGETRILGGSSGIVSTFDPDIIINLFGGNDRADIGYLGLGKSVTVRGGAGNDFISAGSGHWASDIDGNIYFEESPGEGNDGLTIIDNGDVNDHDDTHITASKVYADETLTVDATVHWTSNIEFRSLWLNGGEDDVYMHAIPPGLNISLGLGDDTVLYSPESRVMFGFVTPATISGSSGDDRLVFYDDQGGDDGRDYSASATSIMNQTVSGIEDVVLNVRRANNSINTIAFTGLPASDSITINGVGVLGLDDTISFGTPGSRIDLDASSIQLNVNLQSITEIWVVEDDPDVDQYYFYTEAGDVQVIEHGSFIGRFTTGLEEILLHAGGLNDVFNIADQRLGSDISIYGGGGNDKVQTVNFGTAAANHHDNDLDAIFNNLGGLTTFHFIGEDGSDFFDLNDSADQIDDDEMYVVSGLDLRKRGTTGDVLKIGYDSTTELLTVVGDADNNVFTFSGYSTQSFTLNGGPGNDLFQNDRTFGLQACRATVGIIGGDIVDQDSIGISDADPLFNAVTEYRFDSNNFSYFMGLTRLGSIGFGGSTERFDLTQGSAGTTTRLNVQATAFKLTVNAGDGNDTFHVGGGDFDGNMFSLLNTQISGQGGTDSIRFDDRSDAATAGESETLVLDALRVTKGAKAISYALFESQFVDTANVGTGSNTISLVALGGDMASTTINGGNTRPNLVNIGAGGISGLRTINVNLANILGEAVTINDQNNGVNGSSIFETARFTRNPGGGPSSEVIVNHTGVRQINYTGGNDTDFVLISGIAAGTTLNSHAGNGNDITQLGNDGDMSQVLGTANVWGDAGTDSFNFGVLSATPINATLTNVTFGFNGGPTHSYFTMDTLSGGFGAAADTLHLRSMSTPCRIDMGPGTDQVTVGDGDYDANITRDIEVLFGFGFGNGDSLTIDDRLDTGNDSYQFLANNIFRKQLAAGGTTAQLTAGFFAAASQTLLANNDNNSIFCSSGFADLRIFAGGGNDVIFADNGTTTVDTGSELASNGDGLLVNADQGIAGDAPAVVKLAGSDRIFNLVTYSLGTLVIPAGAVLEVANEFSLTGAIDLSGALIVRQPALQLLTLRNWLTIGYAGGAWNGSSATGGSIRSSAAAASSTQDGVGYGLGSQAAVTTVGPFSLDASSMLIRHTLSGDADLNQAVNIADFSRLAANFNGPNKIWTTADFNYDNATNITDFSPLAANFNRTLAAALPRESASPFSVKEIKGVWEALQ